MNDIMDNYVKSKNIKVYPSGYRGDVSDGTTNISYNPESKLNTEANAIKSISKLIRYSNDSYNKGQGDFVISEDYDWSSVYAKKDDNPRPFVPFEFFIKGYYFKILDSYDAFNGLIGEDTITPNHQNQPNNIYAEIVFATSNATEPTNTNSTSNSTILDTNNNYITSRHLGNLKTTITAGSITPGNTNDDGYGTIVDFSNLDNVINNNYYFTGLNLATELPDPEAPDNGHYYFKILTKGAKIKDKTIIVEGESITVPVYNYVVPKHSRIILKAEHIYGGTESGTDQPINQYFNSNNINSNNINNNNLTTNNLYIPPLKDNSKDRNLIINSSGQVVAYDIKDPSTTVDAALDDLKFVTTIKQEANGQVSYFKANVQKATSSQYGVIKSNPKPYSGIYGKHPVKIDNDDADTAYGYVDGIIDGVPVEGIESGTIYLLGYSNISGNCLKANANINLYYYVSDKRLYVPNITATGEVRAGSFYATSDKRLKENLETFNYGPSILDLPIYRYDYIDGPKNQIGCLAQDLHELYPELVKEDRDCYLSIQENKIVYLLIEEVKRLTKRVEELEKKSK